MSSDCSAIRLAVPSDDQQSLCAHFGRAAGYVVVEAGRSGELLTTWRERLRAPAETRDRHVAMLEILRDCDVALVGSIGPRMQKDLKQAGVQVVATPHADVAAAVAALLASDAGPACLVDGQCGAQPGARDENADASAR